VDTHHLQTLPSNMEGSNFSSHTMHLVNVKSTNYLLFCTTSFKVFKYHSIWYVHCVWIGPHNSNSSIEWTNIYVMIWKSGRNFRYNNINVITTFFFNSPNIVVGSTNLPHNLLKTWHKWMIVILQPFVIRCHMHKNNIYCIIPW
jgi:hypothetical protein